MKQKKQIKDICKYFFIAGKNDLPDREFNQKFKEMYKYLELILKINNALK